MTKCSRFDYVDDVEEGVRRVEDGDAYAVIIFPERFTESLYMKRAESILSGRHHDPGERGQEQRKRGQRDNQERH